MLNGNRNPETLHWTPRSCIDLLAHILRKVYKDLCHIKPCSSFWMYCMRVTIYCIPETPKFLSCLPDFCQLLQLGYSTHTTEWEKISFITILLLPIKRHFDTIFYFSASSSYSRTHLTYLWHFHFARWLTDKVGWCLKQWACTDSVFALLLPFERV